MLEHVKNPILWRRYALAALVGFCVLGTAFGAGFFAGRWRMRALSATVAPLDQRRTLPGGHGAIGKITQIEENTIMLQARDGATHTILTDNQTRLERGLPKAARLTLRDLKTGDQIIVIGAPTAQGQIKAKRIRLLNSPGYTPTPAGF